MEKCKKNLVFGIIGDVAWGTHFLSVYQTKEI